VAATSAIRFTVRLTPRGGRDAIDGAGPAGELRCRVSAPPADGAANRALVRLLADAIGVPASAVTIEAGEASRTKRVRVEGVGPGRVSDRWPGTLVRVA
jgi:hypothetical protein